MTPLRTKLFSAAIAATLSLSPTALLYADNAPAATPAAATVSADPAAQAQAVIDKGNAFLKGVQRENGSWNYSDEPPALTAIALRALAGDPKTADQDFVKKGFDWLLTFQKEDGSISSDVLATYNTAIATSAFAKSSDPKFKAAVDKAVAYLKSIEWTDKIEGVANQNEKIDPSDPRYGGWGYGHGSKGRPDLSNAQVAIEALHDAGLKPGDPAFDAALKFISRSQNRSESNDQKWAIDDGGFVYSPANGGISEAGEYTGPNGQRIVRSYGSMTYAGLKSMMYAGLTKDDPRVKAAWGWISKNWTLEANPGIQYANTKDPRSSVYGLYYYFHTLARALRAYGDTTITDAKGDTHDWRLELIAELAKEQQPDGSWKGEQKWMENRPALSTAFAVLAAEEALADLKEHPAK